MACYTRLEVLLEDRGALEHALKELGVGEDEYQITQRGTAFAASLRPGVVDKWGFGTAKFQDLVKQRAGAWRTEVTCKMAGYTVTRTTNAKNEIELEVRRY